MHKLSFLFWKSRYHMLAQLMYRLGLFNSLREWIIVYMKICTTHLKLKKYLHMWLWQNFENWRQLALFHQCRIKNLDDFERDEADAEIRTFKCEGERNDHTLHYAKGFGNVFERRESICCAVLMKHRRKVTGEQVINLQMAQQLKTKNINVVPRQLFCR